MRTHIRMHFDKKGGECNEENYITCIVEEDIIEIPPHNAVSLVMPGTPSPIPAVSPNTNSNQKYHCDSCNYSSTYKSNVVSISSGIFCFHLAPKKCCAPY